MVSVSGKGTLKDRFENFHELLYWLFHTTEGGCTVDTTAAALGIGLSTLHHYILGNRSFPKRLLVPLCKTINRDEPLRWFAEQAGFILIPMPQIASDVTHEVMQKVVHSQKAHLAAVQEVLDALEDDDKRITCDEACAIQDRIQAAYRALAQVSFTVDYVVELGR